MKAKLFTGIAGVGVLATFFLLRQSYERRLADLERSVRAAAERASNETDDRDDRSRLQAEVLAATLTAAARNPQVQDPAPPEPASPAASKAETPPPVTPKLQAVHVAATFSGQRVDATWAGNTERVLGSALKNVLGTANLESVECRSSLCKASLRHVDENTFEEFLDRVVASSRDVWRGEFFSNRDSIGSDGVIRNSIYFAKEGTEIPTL